MKQDMSVGGQYFDNITQNYENNLDASIANGTIGLKPTDESFLLGDANATPPTTPNNSWLDRRAPDLSTIKTNFFSDFNTRFDAGGLNPFNGWDDIRDRWKPEFAEELVKLHPEYCYYEQYLLMQESHKYDRKLLSITDASEAVSLGYFNPLQMTSPDVNTTTYPQPLDANRDPLFFSADSLNTDGNTMKGYLLNYDGSHGKVWTLVENNQSSPGGAGVEVGNPSGGGCLSDYDWYYFRALYLAEKQKIYKTKYENACDLSDFVNGVSGETYNSLIKHDWRSGNEDDDSKVRRFYLDAYDALDDKWDVYDKAAGTYDINLKSRADEFCKNQCDINAEQWMDDLKGCNFTTSDLTDLKNELITICKFGCDERSELGASSSPKYTVNGNSTFEEAFEWMLNKGGYSKSDVCNSQLVVFPGIDKPHIPAKAPLDSCACNKITLNEANYASLLSTSSLPAGICSEAELFTYTYNVDIEDLQLLKCLCANNLNKYSTATSGLCYDNYLEDGFKKCKDGVSEKGKLTESFIYALIENYDLDHSTNTYTITNAKTTPSVSRFFLDRPVFYPNGGNPACTPQISIAALVSGSDAGGAYISRQITIIDNCGFSCTLTVKLYTHITLMPNFAGVLTVSQVAIKSYTSATNKVTIGWYQHGVGQSQLEITGCSSDLQCTAEFIYPEAFVPYEIACQNCITCEELATEFANFKTAHPYLLEPQVHANLIERFTDYLNFNLGRNFTLTDVEDLFDNCTINTTCSTTTAATKLKDLLHKLATNNDLGEPNVNLTLANYPELYDPAIYSGSSTDNPKITNNNPYYYAVSTGSTNETSVVSGYFTYIITHPTNIIDGIKYPVVIKIEANTTTTENTVVYVGDSLGGGETFIIPPLNAGDVYYIHTIVVPHIISGSPNITLLYLNATYQDDNISKYVDLPEGTALIGFDPDATPKNTFTITDDNGFKCTIRFDMPDGLSAANIKAIQSIFADPNAIAGSNVMKAKVLMKGSTDPIEIYIHSTCHTLTTCGTLSTGLTKCPTPLDFTPTDQCTERLNRLAEGRGWIRYQQYIQDKKEEFERNYVAHCMQPFEKFGSTAILNPYQITLYYYDQADNLIKTIPPKGINVLNQASVDSCLAHREDEVTNQRIEPNHEFITYYKYNTLNQLVAQRTPDGGVSNFWYDRLGRLALSQNAKQISNNHYSYTRFDAQDRIIEIGELTTIATITAENVADDAWLTSTINGAISSATQITKTFYDDILLPANTVPGFEQINLRKRVTTMAYYDTYQANNLNFSNATHYTYDIVGNVNQVVQDNPELNRFEERFKAIHYNYDQISGNVNLVAYQPDSLDQYYHFYKYDADNRLQSVYTSRYADWNILQGNDLPDITLSHDWVLDAKQQYFWHGPLLRTELGERQVQGTDYAYTIHGWLKAINSTFGTPRADGGEDGYQNSFGRDAFGFELGYYNGDYKTAGAKLVDVIASQSGSSLASLQTSLYNGNISYSVTSLPDSLAYIGLQLQQQPKAGLYKYDQLNRLTQSMTLDLNAANVSGNSWAGGYGLVPDYSVPTISYDKNGNITALQRNAESGNLYMDKFTYRYLGNTNKLNYVDEDSTVINSTNHYEDVDDQSSENYKYDNIGNLISDAAEEIAGIEWTVYGKVKSITRTGPSLKPDLEFTYDAMGNRLSKKVIPKNGDKPTTTYYIYDASGNVMAINQLTDKASGSPTPYVETLKVQEFAIYGSGRIGIENTDILLAENDYFTTPDDGTYTYYTSISSSTITIELGNKNYELSNHLGNVLATITDRKIPYNNTGTIDHYLPDIANVTDYYPYGMRIEKRSWRFKQYRYGMNTQEADDEIYGEGNSFTAEYWQYDPRLGRRWNLDPIIKDWESPYATMHNNPIYWNDPLGNDPPKKRGWLNRVGNWLQGNGYINRARKFARENNIEENSIILSKNKAIITTVEVSKEGEWLPAGDGVSIKTSELLETTYTFRDGKTFKSTVTATSILQAGNGLGPVNDPEKVDPNVPDVSSIIDGTSNLSQATSLLLNEGAKMHQQYLRTRGWLYSPASNSNYQLTGRNFNIFKNRPVSNNVLPKSFFMKGAKFFNGLGYVASGVSVVYSIHQYNTGEITGQRASYRIGGTVIATGAGYYFGGPVGVAVGSIVVGSEYVYENHGIVTNPARQGFYDMRESLKKRGRPW